MLNHFLTYLEVERHYSALTVEAYRKDLLHFCEHLHQSSEDFHPRTVTEGDVKEWMILQLDAGKNPRTVRRRLSALRSLYKYLLRIGYMDIDPTARIISPKTHKPLPVFFKESEMQRAQLGEEMADDFISVRDSLIIELLYETGMRRAELVSLDDTSISFAEKQVRVLGKRRKERIIPLGERVLEQILLYTKYRDETFGDTRDNKALLVSHKGDRITGNAIYHIVHARMGEVSTLHKQSPHVLRHTFATTMLNNGADINTIKTLMGHASLAATQVYTHTTFEQIKKEYKKAHPRSTQTQE